MSVHVSPIRALNDNYIWCIHDSENAVVVDPGDEKPVLSFLQEHGLSLAAILITHHHWDHVNGLKPLLSHYPQLPVFGPALNQIDGVTQQLKEGDTLTLPHLNIDMRVLDVPGHTLDHIVFVSDIGLFCGDTLFSAGCGRLFEGTPEQMYTSLSKLKRLPDTLPVYCTHEYTMANLAFAHHVTPQNEAVSRYREWAQVQRDKGLATLPTSLKKEMLINPFMRTSDEDIVAAAEKKAGRALASGAEVFAVLRHWKDNF